LSVIGGWRPIGFVAAFKRGFLVNPGKPFELRRKGHTRTRLLAQRCAIAGARGTLLQTQEKRRHLMHRPYPHHGKHHRQHHHDDPGNNSQTIS
jgi:hypothetical protein